VAWIPRDPNTSITYLDRLSLGLHWCLGRRCFDYRCVWSHQLFPQYPPCPTNCRFICEYILYKYRQGIANTRKGASAILCYGAIDVPLAQPRSLIFGHFFSGLVGVIIATIFQFNLQEDPYPRLQWLAASLSTAIALVVMHLTKTTHPPAGATALIPCVDPHIWALRWYYLPVLLLSSMIVLASACVVNNLQRQYPKFWVAQIPPPPPAPAPKPVPDDKLNQRSSDTLNDMERGPL
jgi:CBS-domain-containing membrane protein